MLFATNNRGSGADATVLGAEEGPGEKCGSLGGMSRTVNGWGQGGCRGGKGSKAKAPKNDPFRFEGEGLSFRAKLIGTETVDAARGDRMCQEAMQRLKSVVKLSSEHKQRVVLGVSLQGIKVHDEKSGDLVFHHPVHKISFISQDTGDARAFGYVCGSPQGGHRFVAIKTEKAASQLVIALRDLFQVVLEMKQHEMLRAKEDHEKQKIVIRQDAADDVGAGPANGADFSHRGEVREVLHEETPPQREKPHSPAVVDDLLDLQFELDSLQQGIEQMETSIAAAASAVPTPAAADPFDTSFVMGPSSRSSRPFFSQPVTPMSPVPPLLPPPLPARVPPTFLPYSAPLTPSTAAVAPAGGGCGDPFSPPAASRAGGWPPPPDPFRPRANPPRSLPLRSNNPFATVSLPATPATHFPATDASGTPAAPAEAVPPALPPKKPPGADLFAELDPLSKDRPYRDRGEFFRELKKPAKKALRDLCEEETQVSGPSSVCCPVSSWETFDDGSSLSSESREKPPPSFPPPPPPLSNSSSADSSPGDPERDSPTPAERAPPTVPVPIPSHGPSATGMQSASEDAASTVHPEAAPSPSAEPRNETRPPSTDEGFCSGASSVSPSLPQRHAPSPPTTTAEGAGRGEPRSGDIFSRKKDPFADEFFSGGGGAEERSPWPPAGQVKEGRTRFPSSGGAPIPKGSGPIFPSALANKRAGKV